MTTSNLSYKGYTGSIEASIEDECLHGRVLLIDDLITYEGATVKEMVESFRAVVDRYIDYCSRTGKQANKAYSGVFQTRIDPSLHKAAVLAAAKRKIKLNEFVSQAICAAVNSDGPTKVEHVHQVNVSVTGLNQELVVATTGAAPLWNSTHAITIQ